MTACYQILSAFNHSFIQLFIYHKQFIKQKPIMRKVTNYLWMFMMAATVLFVTSCGEDVENPIGNDASISFDGLGGEELSDTTLTQGDTLTFALDIDFGDAEAADLTVTDDLGNTVFTTNLQTEPTVPTQRTYIVPNDATGDITLTADLTDPDDNSLLATANITITVEPAVAITTSEQFLLAAPLGDGSSEAFYSAETDTRYSYNDIVNTTANLSETIDFGYANGSTEGGSINAPSDFPSFVGYDMSRWGTLNETVFRTLSEFEEADFDAITEDQGNEIIGEFDAASNENNRIVGIEAGQIIAFRTVDNRYGLIKVVQVVGTFNENDGVQIVVKTTEAQDS